MTVSTELFYLALTALLTTLIWLPYGLAMVQQHGPMEAFGNRDHEKPLVPWAERARRAHRNAVENLAVFASLVLIVQAVGGNNQVTAWACIIYFWMRVLHYLAYTFGLVIVRTALWTVGWVCILVLAWQVLA